MVDNSGAHSAAIAVIPKTTPTLVPPINGPAARPLSDAELGFDPNGRGHLWTSIRHPVDALLAHDLSRMARRESEKAYPGTLNGGHNQEGDAFRHAYWNHAMARVMGAKKAKAFADANEISPYNPIGERQMDLYNNREGRGLADSPGAVANTIKKAIADGRLRTRPF